jgi:hypothetical protein
MSKFEKDTKILAKTYRLIMDMGNVCGLLLRLQEACYDCVWCPLTVFELTLFHIFFVLSLRQQFIHSGYVLHRSEPTILSRFVIFLRNLHHP